MPNHSPPDLTKLEPILARRAGGGRNQLLPTLWEVQGALGYLPEAAVEAIGQKLRIPLAEIYGVIDFYSMLYTRPVGRKIVRVCTSPPCATLGGPEALQAACQQLGLEPGQPSSDGALMIEESPCLGLCDHAPAALVHDIPIAQAGAEPPKRWIERPQAAPLGAIGGEPRRLTARCGEIPPTDLEAYLQRDGFAGLRRALEHLQPAEVVQTIVDSGLVGRGGAAFPTGLKWQYTAAAPSEPRYVVCNADESEPGTFKDRVLMEGDPFSVLEGMTLAGYAIGSQHGFLYVRGEYPRAQRILSEAIQVARQAGYLGQRILGSDFSFEIELRSGAGAYICGEETALFESIEGKRGMPRVKPPFPTTHGLFGQPTCINNVETLCTAGWIIANGAEAHRAIGTERSPGSKLFCLSGDVARPGVYEAPHGIPLGGLLELAGGVQGELQAILLGGAAGSFARPDQLDLPMSLEATREAGLSLGSGVVMAFNRERDLRQVLLSLAHFFAHESCGKCFPCQLGTQRQLEIVGRMAQGRAGEGDLEALHDVEFTMRYASLCGLGMTAGLAVRSALEQWPDLFQNGR